MSINSRRSFAVDGSLIDEKDDAGESGDGDGGGGGVSECVGGVSEFVGGGNVSGDWNGT